MDEQNIFGIKYEVDIESLKTSSVEAKKASAWQMPNLKNPLVN